LDAGNDETLGRLSWPAFKKRQEVAGSWALAGSECYGDLMLAPISMMSGTPARHQFDVCTREVGRVQ
jgi:hypothetical protein